MSSKCPARSPRESNNGDGSAEGETVEEVEPVAEGFGGSTVDVPSSSHPPSFAGVLPEHFVEAVAVEVAVNAARSAGRLAAAPAVAAVFQVCSMWRAASQSELLWRNLTRRIWTARPRPPSPPSWRDDFVRRHVTAVNFRVRRYAYSRAPPPSRDLSCCRIALSDNFIAVGFLDGSVHLFNLPAMHLIANYLPDFLRDRLGHLSQAISGIVLGSLVDRLTFASQDGDIRVVNLDYAGLILQSRTGNVMDDGTLVDFTGDDRWWVGLFAGVPGRSWQVWNAATEMLVYVGGNLMDPHAVLGWHMLTDLSGAAAGRVRMAGPSVAVGCTASSIEVLDLDEMGKILNRVELPRDVVVESLNAYEDRLMVVDMQGRVNLCKVPTLQELCRFRAVRRAATAEEGVRQWDEEAAVVRGCMNWGYVIAYASGRVRVWDAETGQYLYRFRERVGDMIAMVAGDRYVAAWDNETGLHLWDFGAWLAELVVED
ncbi:hypothetical protein Cni_G19188 [Canna indica]|uniref:Transcriptional regulator STERILE APETALA n=1 Tax=Canna indica TaxID=4628 RepID=A0AAQ3KP18_9LILI|nr:hypothetical protein Cni_G19188 [Canna indica]